MLFKLVFPTLPEEFMNPITPVLLCGGVGSRLWPVSRQGRPKQYLNLTEDQSTYIPIGAKHRLSNPGKYPLELIEVQSGSYLGEDDIVRFEDVYGRSPN